MVSRYSQTHVQDCGLIASQAFDWWFERDPSPVFLVDGGGILHSANPSAERVLQNGHLAVNGAGAMKFGSGESDAAYLSAVRAVAGKEVHCRAVLRQMDGGWFGAGLYGSPDEPLVAVVLRMELTPRPDSMSAIGAAFRLTPSELEVLNCLLLGLCPKSVATQLSISEHTVRAHLRSLYAKMNARGLTTVIKMACAFI